MSTPKIINLTKKADILSMKESVRPFKVELNPQKSIAKSICNLKFVLNETSQSEFYFMSPVLDVKYESEIRQSSVGAGNGFYCAASIYERYNPNGKKDTYDEGFLTTNHDFLRFLRHDLSELLQTHLPSEFFSNKPNPVRTTLETGVREEDGDSKSAKKEGAFASIRIPFNTDNGQLSIYLGKLGPLKKESGGSNNSPTSRRKCEHVKEATKLPAGQLFFIFSVHTSRTSSLSTVLTASQVFIDKESIRNFSSRPMIGNIDGIEIDVETSSSSSNNNNASEECKKDMTTADTHQETTVAGLFEESEKKNNEEDERCLKKQKTITEEFSSFIEN